MVFPTYKIFLLKISSMLQDITNMSEENLIRLLGACVSEVGIFVKLQGES